MMLLICDLLAITIILTGLGKQSNGKKTESSRFGCFYFARWEGGKRTLKSHKTDTAVPKKEKFSEFVPFLI